MRTKKLNLNHIIKLHEKLIKHTGGISGIRDIRLLDSALESPFAFFDGRWLYPTIQKKAARLTYGIIKNHAFADGNKRIGILAMVEFLKLNGYILNCPHDDLIKLGLSVADGTFDEKDILEFIIKHENK